MKLLMILMLAITTSCSSAPRKFSKDIKQERDVILTTAMPKFQQCVSLEQGEVHIQMRFKLFSKDAPFLSRPQKVAVDPETNRDEIEISLNDPIMSHSVKVACIKDVIRKLDFQPVNPTYEYMETHEYVLKIPAVAQQNG